jgi:flagellar hook-associated protein 3 FlgL
MSIRMPNSIQTRQMLLGLQRTQDRLAQNSLRVSSGERITNPGDDPAGAAAILDFGTSIQANDQFQKQADSALSFLKSSEDAVGSVTNSITRLQQLAQQGLSGTSGASGRAAIAAEVDSIRTNLLALSNTKVQGKYLFSGMQTQTQPFSGPSAGPITYQGDGGVINLNVSVGTSVATNIPGSTIFFGTGGQGSATDLFQAVTDLRDALTTNNSAQIQTAYTNLQSIQSSVTQVQTDLGGRQAGLTDLQSMLSGFNLTLQGLQSNVQDTNYPDTLTQVSSDTTVQSATLSTLAKTNQQSLFNYLG